MNVLKKPSKGIIISSFTLFFYHLVSFSQVGIGTTTPNSNTALAFSSSSKKLLVPSTSAMQNALLLQLQMVSIDAH